ncbi:hypothetical protein K9N68_36050 (plasmid) [Kovacikia minuta CCNUW1]|uniref:hypothetical protein n=1 Tax=Kovacikia minuta TaxID=2931930 RepID=UPI001CCD3762|nr:hypothetical protein [Kovacikia minuta]UBF30590.1 hypothetical protein K9N68_36050 [Kovacikia minuta CCNUW1]
MHHLDAPMESTLVSTQSTPTDSGRANPNGNIHFEGIFIWFPLCFLVVWSIARLCRGSIANSPLRAPKLSWHEMTFKRPAKIPCRSCRYFTNNAYLKCTVHPTIAMTQAATDCSDYQNKHGENPFQNKLK